MREICLFFAIISHQTGLQRTDYSSAMGALFRFFSGWLIRSPVSRRALGECNAIDGSGILQWRVDFCQHPDNRVRRFRSSCLETPSPVPELTNPPARWVERKIEFRVHLTIMGSSGTEEYVRRSIRGSCIRTRTSLFRLRTRGPSRQDNRRLQWFLVAYRETGTEYS